MGILNKKTIRCLNNQVPSKYNFIINVSIFMIILNFCFESNYIICENDLNYISSNEIASSLLLSSSSYSSSDNYLIDKNGMLLSNDELHDDIYGILQQTPPLKKSIITSTIDKETPKIITKKLDENILPAKVFHRYYNEKPEINFFSPIFESKLSYNNNDNSYQYNNLLMPSLENTINPSNSFDLIEPGSGFGINWEETSNIMEDSTTINKFDQTNLISPTPMLTPILSPSTEVPSFIDELNSLNNKPPTLDRRLPKLSVISGQVWRYFIPVDTFSDEDGDLRNLKTKISIKKLNFDNVVTANLDDENNIGISDDNRYYSWLQYDPNSLLLYGFPMETDIGKHKFVLTVIDKMGSYSEEVIEINVHQHQSIRAFTHVFLIEKVNFSKDKYPSMVDALGEFIKRISTQVYLEQPFRDIIVQNYIINDSNKQKNNSSSTDSNNNNNLSFTLTWSNSSIPIYPCNISSIESMAKLLINTQALNYDWLVERSPKLNLEPSSTLIKALAPEFKPTSVSIYLQGTCDGRESNEINAQNLASTFELKTKIGQLNWKLGQLIEYHIPDEIFVFNNSSIKNKDFLLTLHTIDGLTLDKDPLFSYLEFNSVHQIIYGLPYNQDIHSGQRELMLTAWHLPSGQKIREVFIINIEPQDLTTINNRAFKMSLYLFCRSGFFGPRERVQLGHKMVGGIKSGLSTDLENPEILVVNIQKFFVNSYQTIADSKTHSFSYEDKVIKIIDTNVNELDKSQTSNQFSNLYKFTWTNASIGYRGDCPVEVIKQHILGALENSMEDLQLNTPLIIDNEAKNDTVLFYDRLRMYFEPEFDLIHLRFEPIGACTNALRFHEVGFTDIADSIDKAEDLLLETSQEILTSNVIATTTTSIPMDLDAENDVYWSIVELIILSLGLIFIIIVFIKSIHMYCINQDKKLENQIRLAQARQNSMYLSSMVLANQADPNNICGQILPQNMPKSMYVVQDEEKGSRKPVILENEKQLLTTSLVPTSVQISSHPPIQAAAAAAIRQSLTSLDTSNIWRPQVSPQVINSSLNDEKHRSMTLHRRPTSGSIQQFMNHNVSSMNNLNHSQSILTVASLATPLPVIPHGRLPIVYAQVPLISSGPQEHLQQSYASLQRGYNQQRSPNPTNIQIPFITPENSIIVEQPVIQNNNNNHSLKLQAKVNVNGSVPYNNRSPSYSSSTSATTQSIVSVQNVGKYDRTEV